MVGDVGQLKSGLASRKSVRELRENLVDETSKDPVIYMWWFRRDGASAILRAVGENVDNVNILHDKIDGADYLALYVGKGKSCRQRFDWHIRQHHDERTVRHGFLSTLRQTLCALMGVNAVDGEAVVNRFIDLNCYLDWTCYPDISEEELSKLEEAKIASGYFPLNIVANKTVPQEVRKPLRKLRIKAKKGMFPVRQTIADGTWTQKDLNALVAAGWDEIYYPDEIDKLKASVLGTKVEKPSKVLPKLTPKKNYEGEGLPMAAAETKGYGKK